MDDDTTQPTSKVVTVQLETKSGRKQSEIASTRSSSGIHIIAHNIVSSAIGLAWNNQSVGVTQLLIFEIRAC
jgi:hypothetical protein